MVEVDNCCASLCVEHGLFVSVFIDQCGPTAAPLLFSRLTNSII